MKIKDTTGKPFSLRTVFKEAISFFKKHALEAITRKTTVISSDVLWVLTIPAIWSEPAVYGNSGRGGTCNRKEK